MSNSSLFKIIDTVDSTNNYAMGQLHAGLARHGMAWSARDQTQGKGQRGKIWQTEAGANIALSIVIEPMGLRPDQQFLLSMATALATERFFHQYAGEETSIKWPNDIYWRDRKAGGILIENVFHGKAWKWAVVGIGLNINQSVFAPELKNPVSLTQITGIKYDAQELAFELYGFLLNCIQNLESEVNINEYNAKLFRRNRSVRLKKGMQVFDTVIQRVASDGQLLTIDAIERRFDFGEVEWLI